jgi:hypothetical protein
METMYSDTVENVNSRLYIFASRALNFLFNAFVDNLLGGVGPLGSVPTSEPEYNNRSFEY